MANERLRSVPERPSDGTVTLVDSNVLLDILTEDPKTFSASNCHTLRVSWQAKRMSGIADRA